MVSRFNSKMQELAREESGIAAVLTLFFIMPVIVMVLAIALLGHHIQRKIELQTAVDSAAHAGALAQADTISKIAVINRAIAWTYVQNNRRHVDYIMHRFGLDILRAFCHDSVEAAIMQHEQSNFACEYHKSSAQLVELRDKLRSGMSSCIPDASCTLDDLLDQIPFGHSSNEVLNYKKAKGEVLGTNVAWSEEELNRLDTEYAVNSSYDRILGGSDWGFVNCNGFEDRQYGVSAYNTDDNMNNMAYLGAEKDQWLTTPIVIYGNGEQKSYVRHGYIPKPNDFKQLFDIARLYDLIKANETENKNKCLSLEEAIKGGSRNLHTLNYAAHYLAKTMEERINKAVKSVADSNQGMKFHLLFGRNGYDLQYGNELQMDKIRNASGDFETDCMYVPSHERQFLYRTGSPDYIRYDPGEIPDEETKKAYKPRGTYRTAGMVQGKEHWEKKEPWFLGCDWWCSAMMPISSTNVRNANGFYRRLCEDYTEIDYVSAGNGKNYLGEGTQEFGFLPMCSPWCSVIFPWSCSNNYHVQQQIQIVSYRHPESVKVGFKPYFGTEIEKIENGVKMYERTTEHWDKWKDTQDLCNYNRSAVARPLMMNHRMFGRLGCIVVGGCYNSGNSSGIIGGIFGNLDKTIRSGMWAVAAARAGVRILGFNPNDLNEHDYIANAIKDEADIKGAYMSGWSNLYETEWNLFVDDWDAVMIPVNKAWNVLIFDSEGGSWNATPSLEVDYYSEANVTDLLKAIRNGLNIEAGVTEKVISESERYVFH